MQRTPRLEHCFKEGMQARDDGQPLAGNPYGLRTPEHREWSVGWSATFDLDEDDDPESMRAKPGTTDNGTDLDDT